jgi:hypothetical protein
MITEIVEKIESYWKSGFLLIRATSFSGKFVNLFFFSIQYLFHLDLTNSTWKKIIFSTFDLALINLILI